MKIPGVGEVEPKYLMLGGGVIGLIVIWKVYSSKKTAAANANAASQAIADTQNQGDGTIDPTTGIPFADEGGVYGYGAVDPSTGIPFQYENQSATSSASTYTNNQEWADAAIQYSQEDLGSTQALAQQAISDYLADKPGGLPANEYTLVSEIIALIGPPPVGSFNLFESTGTTGGNPPGGTGTGTYKSLSPGQQINVQVNITGSNTMQKVATQYGIALQHLINNNPGSNASTKGVVNVPYEVQSGDTVDKVAAKFGIAPEHLEMELASQGII